MKLPETQIAWREFSECARIELVGPDGGTLENVRAKLHWREDRGGLGHDLGSGHEGRWVAFLPRGGDE